MRSTQDTAILTIAGTHPSGREGIQADLNTFAAHGCHGTSVVTAVTTHSTTGVQRVIMSPDFVHQQLSSTLSDVHVHAIKTGTLFDASLAQSIAALLQSHFETHGRVPYVCDSVHVSEYGVVLSSADVHAIVRALFPLARVVTLSETDVRYVLNVLGQPLPTGGPSALEEMLVAAQRLMTFGPRAVLVKADRTAVSLAEVMSVKAPDGTSVDVRSDMPLGEAINILGMSDDTERKEYTVDVLCCAGGGTAEVAFTLYPQKRSTKHVRGADDPFSAALACSLGNDLSVEEAVARATTYTRLGIETALSFGKAHGPASLNHFHSTSELVVQPITTTCPYPLTLGFIQKTAAVWKQYVRHDFVVQLGKGTLDSKSFRHFIQQDYLYLKYYARAHALLASKFNDFASIHAAAKAVLGIMEEANPTASRPFGGIPSQLLMSRKSAVHASLFAKWGMSLLELEKIPESPATTAYGAFLIDMGLQGDTSVLVMAVAACLLGYGEVGLWLKREAEKPNSWVVWQGNPYLEWMEMYSGEDFQAGVVGGLELMEQLAKADVPSRLHYDVWFSVWERTVQFEKGFWDMALNLS